LDNNRVFCIDDDLIGTAIYYIEFTSVLPGSTLFLLNLIGFSSGVFWFYSLRKPKKLFVTLIPIIVWAIVGTFGAFWELVAAY
jgi:hypothetical protein